jgi:FkbM family methyltransferase
MKTVTKVRLAALMSRGVQELRKLGGQGSQAIVKRRGFIWDLDLNEGVDLAIFLFGGFEQQTAKALKKLVRPGSTVLDVGANIGSVTLVLAKLVDQAGRVYAFEPTDYAIRKLKRNLALNPGVAKRVIVEQMRLTCEERREGPVEIYSSWKLAGEARRHPKHRGIAQSTQGSTAASLDDYCEKHGIPKVDFIKLDVDGFEGEVLAGAINLLKRDRPSICMELAPYALAERGSSIHQVFGILEACNYGIRTLAGCFKPVGDPYRLASKIPDGAGTNILAIAE